MNAIAALLSVISNLFAKKIQFGYETGLRNGKVQANRGWLSFESVTYSRELADAKTSALRKALRGLSRWSEDSSCVFQNAFGKVQEF